MPGRGNAVTAPNIMAAPAAHAIAPAIMRPAVIVAAVPPTDESSRPELMARAAESTIAAGTGGTINKAGSDLTAGMWSIAQHPIKVGGKDRAGMEREKGLEPSTLTLAT